MSMGGGPGKPYLLDKGEADVVGNVFVTRTARRLCKLGTVRRSWCPGGPWGWDRSWLPPDGKGLPWGLGRPKSVQVRAGWISAGV